MSAINMSREGMLEVAIIADDLTGAGDAGVQFSPYFSHTVLVSYCNLSLDFLGFPSQALAVYTNSRSIRAESAGERVGDVARQLLAFHPKWVYKKVDSCLRGNLGAEVDATVDEMGFELSFIAPAFPGMGRTTLHDIHQVDGIPVAQTELSRDPVTPVTESRLSRVVASQSRYQVGHVDVRFLGRMDEEILREIDRLVYSGARHVVFDATVHVHLDEIARLALISQKKILLVGSAGLSESLARHFPQGPLKDDDETRVFPEGNHLIVCGTVAERMNQQILKLLGTYPYEVIDLRPDILVDPIRRDELRLNIHKTRHILAENDLIIRIEKPETEKAAADRRSWTAEQIVEGLGVFVASVLRGTKPASLFLSGGDTANAVLKNIGARGIRLFGEIVPGMVQGTLIGGLADGLPVVTKAGAFGEKDTLVALQEYWRKKMEAYRDDFR